MWDELKFSWESFSIITVHSVLFLLLHARETSYKKFNINQCRIDDGAGEILATLNVINTEYVII